MISLLVLAQLTIGSIALKPADYLDGRAIAGGTGAPVVMLTLTEAAAARVKANGLQSAVSLDGKPTEARIAENIVEVEGQPTFEAAAKLALTLTGKPPLPDSLEE